MRLFNNFFLALLTITMLIFSETIAYSFEPLGTTGKIAGKVTDENGSPLPGATLKVENTQMGAVSDAAGDYVIINVPVGKYSVKCSYLGYDPVLQTDVNISADVTTTVDFRLKETGGIKTEEVLVIAKRNTLSPDQSGKIIGTEFIETTGIRGIENIASKTAGVVQDEDGAHINIRGGRDNETAVIIDGILTTNPLDGNSTAYVSNNLLQELAVLTGGFSAEYGNVLSGVINVTTKSGSDKYSGIIEVLSDGVYDRLLNTNSQGYNIYSVNLGGPLIPTKKLGNFLNFYGGVERNFLQVHNPSWIADQLDLSSGNTLPGFLNKRWSGNGKLNADFSTINKKLLLRFVGGVNISRTDRRLWVQSYMRHNWNRNPQILEDNDQFYGKITHQFSNKVFYELQFNYFKTESIQQDPLLIDNLFWYGDPDHVPLLEFPGGRIGFDKYGMFALENRINNFYEKQQTQYYEGSFNILTQLKHNEIKLGGNYRYHTIRLFQISPIVLAQFKAQFPDSLDSPYFREYVDNLVNTNYFGYTFSGASGVTLDLANDDSKLSEGSVDGAKHPVVASLYLQDKIEFQDFTLNAGLRFDYLDPASWRIKDINNAVRFGDPNAFDIEDVDLESDPTYAVSPRLGFSFPVTERTIFHAQFGKFIQMPNLELLYNGYGNMRYWINIGGFAGTFGNPNLKPEKTTSYEIGVKQQFGDKLSVDLTAFYKETEDLIGIKRYIQEPSSIQVYANQDYGTIRGVDLAIDFRRTSRVAFSIAYSLSFASGTGSDPNSSSIAHWLGDELPKFTNLLDYDQRHTGTLNLDYRFGKTDVPKGFWGAVLSRLGLNLLYSFNSGRPYSKKDPAVDPLASTGSGATLKSSINGAFGPWNHRLDMKLDKTVSVWRLDFNFYIWVINALNTRLVNDVWPGSGDPGDAGYLATQQGINRANAFDTDTDPTTSAEEFRKLYGLRTMEIDNYGPPRQIRFGIKMNF
ncbi:MAG: TonB-dependent receptor [Chlorobi bacterium]|nr:TonB-dependent receptor [Chlorobiota bacterium]MCI0714998.1 TonB-dependent receptor [Chlorobiota bacterium]